MKYRPGVHPWSGNRNTDCPLAAVTATLAIVRRLLERAACQRVRLLRRAAHSRGIRDWNSYLPAAGVLGRRYPHMDGVVQRAAPHKQRPAHGGEARLRDGHALRSQSRGLRQLQVSNKAESSKLQTGLASS